MRGVALTAKKRAANGKKVQPLQYSNFIIRQFLLQCTCINVYRNIFECISIEILLYIKILTLYCATNKRSAIYFITCRENWWNNTKSEVIFSNPLHAETTQPGYIFTFLLCLFLLLACLAATFILIYRKKNTQIATSYSSKWSYFWNSHTS